MLKSVWASSMFPRGKGLFLHGPLDIPSLHPGEKVSDFMEYSRRFLLAKIESNTRDDPSVLWRHQLYRRDERTVQSSPGSACRVARIRRGRCLALRSLEQAALPELLFLFFEGPSAVVFLILTCGNSSKYCTSH